MDKRAAVRVPVRGRAQCRTQGLVIDGLVEDVSRSGLFMRTPRRTINEGAPIEIALDLPGEQTLHLSAEVVRIESAPRPGLAVKFIGNGERHRRPLANFIMRQHQTIR